MLAQVQHANELAVVIAYIVGAVVAIWPVIKFAQLILAWLRPVSRAEFDALVLVCTATRERVKQLENYKAQTDEMRQEKMELKIKELTGELERKQRRRE